MLNESFFNKILSVSILGKDNISLFDIYVNLSLKPGKPPFLINITKKMTLDQLQQLIKDNIEMLYEEFKGLKGFKIKAIKVIKPQLNYPNNLLTQSKKSEVGQGMLGPSYYEVDTTSGDDLAMKYFTSNCQVRVEVESQEIWMKVQLKFKSN